MEDGMKEMDKLELQSIPLPNRYAMLTQLVQTLFKDPDEAIGPVIALQRMVLMNVNPEKREEIKKMGTTKYANVALLDMLKGLGETGDESFDTSVKTMVKLGSKIVEKESEPEPEEKSATEPEAVRELLPRMFSRSNSKES